MAEIKETRARARTHAHTHTHRHARTRAHTHTHTHITTLIWPILSYGCETWTTTQSSEKRLAIFERKILRRILGPVYEDDLGWRLRHNKELYELLDGPDIVKFIKFKRLQWACHIVWMDNSRIPKKVLDGKFHGRRPVLRPRLRWEDIRRNLLLLNIRGWRKWAGDRHIWRLTIEEARTRCGRSHHWRRRYDHNKWVCVCVCARMCIYRHTHTHSFVVTITTDTMQLWGEICLWLFLPFSS
jgi:hypothetical protein